MFEECSIEHFGKMVGFTKPSKTWFGGNLIALLHLLRLKQAMMMCVCNPKFVKKKSIDMLYLFLRRSLFGAMLFLFSMHSSQ